MKLFSVKCGYPYLCSFNRLIVSFLKVCSVVFFNNYQIKSGHFFLEKKCLHQVPLTIKRATLILTQN